MGIRLPSARISGGFVTAVNTTVETLIATTGVIECPLDGAIVHVLVYVDLTMGTTGTAWMARIRLGAGLTGTVILQTPAITLAAGNVDALSLVANDGNAGMTAYQQYSLTIQCTAATANSTVGSCSMFAMVL